MKSKRHLKILELITDQHISTQEDLLIELKKSGFDVTQATVSRDIKELRLVKTLSSDGRYIYTTTSADKTNDLSYKFNSFFTEAVISVDRAGNFIVIKCFTGMANAACAALDTIEWKGMVGTLAGDDTIFIIMRTEEDAENLEKELKNVLAK